MQIYVNGEERHTDATSISSLLVELAMQGRMIAIERNLEVVPKSTYAEAMLVEGDRIEIVHMIGGG
ncbi:MAG: sulfur carrier protein ThiS [Mariprofundaceae bacterium]|nr:sulfur carrier protein ThiS [Mariprofundaceae bacterium]